ncbi:hypothetical protein BB560_001945 [Smittium megazygosporum]|uniref:FAD-binding domain-containing protein n=1 Tax=Smittium megazygosporum TaxID=133381 RepID=A0A2T9ZG66_9FUNG|nr:hypothetical protein BB560_001945 [Smittium megazygosporum]
MFVNALKSRCLATKSFASFRQFSSTRSSLQNALQYDVTIIGAGIAGSSLACALKSQEIFKNLKVAIVDPAPIKKIAEWNPPLDSFSNRTVQITNATQRFLKRVWDSVFQERIQSYSKVVVSDFLGKSSVKFDDSVGTGNDSAAFLIENINLTSGCAKILTQTENSNVDVYTAKVEEISHYDASSETTVPPSEFSPKTQIYPQLSLSDNSCIRTRLLIGTDGANSVVRKFANISHSVYPYEQSGLVACAMFSELNNTAYQRFLPTGPIVFLPHPNGFANLIWSIDNNVLSKLKNVSDETFVTLVNMAFRLRSYSDLEYILNSINEDGSIPENFDLDKELEWCKRLSLDPSSQSSNPNEPISLPPLVKSITKGSRQSFPYRLSNASTYYSHRIALVGDAAHTMHPLAGMGFNSGVYDIIELCKYISKAISNGEDIGSTEYVLKPYNSARYAADVALQSYVDELWHLFRSKNPIITTGRGIAMRLLDKFPLIKSQVVKQIMY